MREIKYLCLLLLLFIVSITVDATSTLGTYCGNPNGNSSPAMKAFEANFDSFSTAMNSLPRFMNSFVDYTKEWDTWVENAEWSAWSWTLSNRSKHLIPVIGIPMLPSSYYNNEGEGLDEVIAGQHDDVFVGIVKAYAANNFTTLHLRIGWEPNGNWYSWNWNGKNSSGDSIAPQWVAAWRRIATIVKSVNNTTIYTTWNPCLSNYSPFNIINTTYPGDDFVDIIGLDIYSPVWPGSLYDWQYNNGTIEKNISVWCQSNINREHYWNFPAANQWVPNSLNGWGMVLHLEFAKERKKPIAICESGVGLSPSAPTQGLADDGDFPIYVKKQIEASGLELVYINIWDVNVGDGLWLFSDGSKPYTASSWKISFGNQN